LNKPTKAKSIASLKLKAEEGDAKAQYQLGVAYAKGGKAVKRDNRAAIAWLEKSALQNHIDAQLELGGLYSHMGIALRDYEKSYQWTEQAASTGNHPEAHYQLAGKYSAGQGVNQDMQKAMEHYKKSGELGHVSAMETLGNGYFRGEGVPKDLAKAHFWYEKGAETGESSHLQYLTALSYKEGMAGKESPGKALFWLEKSVEKGNGNALYYLGRLYIFGDTVKQDSNKGIPLLKKAVEKGQAEAADLLGKLFFDNNMLVDAHKYLTKAYAMGKEDVKALMDDPRMAGIAEAQQKAVKEAYINLARYISKNHEAIGKEIALYFDDAVAFNHGFEEELDFIIESPIDALVFSLEKRNHIKMVDHKCEPDSALESLNQLAGGQLAKNEGRFNALHAAYKSSDMGVANFIGNKDETGLFDLVNSTGFALIGLDNNSDALSLALIEKSRIGGLIKLAESAEVSLQYVDFNDVKKQSGLSSLISKISLFKR
jgi:TPR repeat protein